MLKIRKQQFDQMSEKLLTGDNKSLVIKVAESPQQAVTVAGGTFKIRDDQFAALNEVLDLRFQDRLFNEVVILFPENFEPMPENPEQSAWLREMLGQIIKHSASYGIEEDGDIAAYCALTLGLKQIKAGSLLQDLDSWIKPILELPDASGKDRMALIEVDLKRLAPDDLGIARLYGTVEAIRKRFV